MSLIMLYYIVKSSSSQFRFICISLALTTISHRPRHMCQTMTFASGSPRPLAPWSKTIHHILPLCPPCPPQQPSATASRLLGPCDVGICVGAHPVPRRVCGHACLCRWASGEGKRTFTHACISGNPLSPMLNKLNMCCFLFL